MTALEVLKRENELLRQTIEVSAGRDQDPGPPSPFASRAVSDPRLG